MTLSENTFPATTRAAVPYGQGRARGLGADVLGVHGVEMDNLVALGLPVVPGLTVPIGAGSGLQDHETATTAIDLLEKLAVRGIWPAVVQSGGRCSCICAAARPYPCRLYRPPSRSSACPAGTSTLWWK